MKQIDYTATFLKQWKTLQKKHYSADKLTEVVRYLAESKGTITRYKDHALIGDKTGYRECHIMPN